jgi:hypothetical protein
VKRACIGRHALTRCATRNIQKSMKDRLMAKFGSFALDPEETASTFDLRNILSIRLLFIRLQVSSHSPGDSF